MVTKSCNGKENIKRTRTSTSKVRTGCRTCKDRRLKCDETKPTCMRCMTSKRVCQGYRLDLSSTAFVRTASTLRVYTAPGDLRRTTAQERSSLDFFRTKTSKELPGVFPSDFWDRLVLQASYENDALLHLSIALGALHQKAYQEGMAIPSQDIANKTFRFALLEYNKSVHLLQQLLHSANTRHEREICLIACVLLICFEILRGHYGTAMLHLKSGRNVLTEYLFGPTDSYDTIVLQSRSESTSEDDLANVFARLDIQAAHFGFVSPQFKLSTSIYSDTKRIPSTFVSHVEARTYFDILANAVERFLTAEHASRPTPNPMTIKHREELLCHLEQWLNALPTRDTADHTPAETQKILLLKLNHLYLHMKLETCFETSITELAYDSQMLTFELLLQTVEACLRTMPLPSISLDIGIIQPLYVTAIKCRDPHLRRRALSMLWSTPHREGMWDATLEAMTAARIIQLEEGGIHHPLWVPEQNRFLGVYIILKGEGDEGGTLYCTQRKGFSQSPGMEVPGLPEDIVVHQHNLDFDGGALVRQILGT